MCNYIIHTYIFLYIIIYIYIYIHIIHTSLCVCIYIYIMCIYIYVCAWHKLYIRRYIYIYIICKSAKSTCIWHRCGVNDILNLRFRNHHFPWRPGPGGRAKGLGCAILLFAVEVCTLPRVMVTWDGAGKTLQISWESKHHGYLNPETLLIPRNSWCSIKFLLWLGTVLQTLPAIIRSVQRT